MNERVRSHFDEIEARLIECPVILSYQITRRDISLDDGKLRIKSDALVKSQEFPPPRRGRVRVGVVSGWIQSCLFPLPFIPSRRGRGKWTFYEFVKSALIGGGVFECFLYVKDTGHRIYPLKFSFHWQDAEGKPVRRLDNAPHHTDLPYAPNHLHTGADHVEGFSGNPDIFAFIDKMERNLIKK
jgi:hypothetical protein